MEKIIAQGAEAKIILSNNFIIKDRVPKAYRLDILDKKIRKSRTKAESKLLEKAASIINSPKPFFQPCIEGATKIKMPFIDGKRLSTNLDSFTLKKQEEICKIIGMDIGKLHDAGIIHGDLTTSNMILVEKKALQVFFIDFGLGYISRKTEDKAVDLHLLKQALEAKHFKNWQILWKQVESGYKNSKESGKIIERLMAVEKRGRYKDKY